MSAATPLATEPDAGLYIPRPARILEVTQVTERERFYRVALDAPLGHRPGQFVMLSLLGLGEAPISISCGPREDNLLEMVIREAGSLTAAMARLGVGDVLGVRGPFGSGFHLEDFWGARDHFGGGGGGSGDDGGGEEPLRDALFVCGGLGLAPLRSLIQPVVAARDRFRRIFIVSGARTPDAELYRDELRAWADLDGVEVIRLVDHTAHQPWDGEVGLVTKPLSTLDFDPERVVAALCGPPVMYKFVVLSLAARGVTPGQIFVDLERRMRCGVGKCGHCQLGRAYCCQEGPVFRLTDVAQLPEAL